ncbi:hypothetical protein GQ457_16G018940 [Hibiscus cannabinus]
MPGIRNDQPGRIRKQQYLVKDKDLKPKRIKGYLEYKFSQMTLPSRVTVYKQAKHLLGLRHKPVTLQDALPRSDPSQDNLPRPDPLFHLDPENERTQKQLKRRLRDLMERNNNGQQPADGPELPARANGAIAPPAQQMNQQLLARTIRDYLAEDLEGLNPAVTMPDFEAEHFELKRHVKSFLEICNSFKIHGVSNDVLKLKLFPYSLRDKAKTWLNNLQPDSLQSWTQLCRCFLAKFCYTNMTDHLRNQITSLRDLFRHYPMHGLPEWTQVSIFYNSVNTPTRMMLDASANGTLLDKSPRESLEILDKLAQNDYQHPTSRRGNTRRGPAQLDSSDNILAQIASLTNMVKMPFATNIVKDKDLKPSALKVTWSTSSAKRKPSLSPAVMF